MGASRASKPQGLPVLGALPKVSLEQWRSFIAVVEAGSYAAAAERAHKTQSTLTYHVQKIERLLELRLFEVKGRKAEITTIGQLLYERATTLLAEAQRLETTSQQLAAGWEPQLSIAVDTLFPSWLLLECIQAFDQLSQTPRLEVIESVLEGSGEALLSGQANMAITSRVPAGFTSELLMSLPIVAVAAPTHPLQQANRELRLADLKPHRHIFIRESGSQRRSKMQWDEAEQRLTVSHKATSIRALCMGLGFSWVPEVWIKNELANGELKRLPLATGSERQANLYLVQPEPEFIGLGQLQLAAIIRQQVQRAAL